MTGTAFLAGLCDCRQQLHESLRRIADNGHGIVLYLDQEGRSHGLVEKVAQLDLIAHGYDTVDAARMRGKEEDLRRYDDATAMLVALIGRRPIRLLTNNPVKIAGLQRTGVEIRERLAIETPPTDSNRPYLDSKKSRMGHLLELV